MKTLTTFLWILFTVAMASGQSKLKSIIYDFDGQDIGQTNLPDGDYKNGDMNYQTVANPLGASDVLADRVLRLNMNWQSGSAEFGKTINRFIELNAATDGLDFYIYNPLSNATDATIHIGINEDDNKDNIFEYGQDDRWIGIVTVHRSSDWQLIHVPFTAFADSNAGGNGIFDAGYTNANGMIFSVGFIFKRTSPADVQQICYLDMLSFTERGLPVGQTPLDLPPANSGSSCLLGAATDDSSPDMSPATINGILGSSSGKKLRFINWFAEYAVSGTTPDYYTGTEVGNLLAAGYRPVITWETQFAQYARLDSVQPRLDKILNGSFDGYIDAFADKIKSYGDTVILRILHEFEGNWYAWSLTENHQDPSIYIAAYRHIVDRFRARGATKVKWMWCINAEPKPYVAYNWIVNAYPGDSYVDIVATDVYNHPDLGTPPWKSFRCTVAESYYYLTTYFPSKPFYICEVGCRERDASEDATSQTKAGWICQMNKDIQSYFCKTQALIFFSKVKEHDWRINSSAATENAVKSCIWNDGFYTTGMSEYVKAPEYHIYPNPFVREIRVAAENTPEYCAVKIADCMGRELFVSAHYKLSDEITACAGFPPGMYIVELSNGQFTKSFKVIKSPE